MLLNCAPELLVTGEDLEGTESEPGGRQSEDDRGLLVLQSAVVEAVPWNRVIRNLRQSNTVHQI